ncbi:LysR family transcriptional regulator [Aliidiomarina indica]|uniref:LysR family transcriptional regulator n=1 Tax=Aliidiomarina indica TaxID=2749147 RepID=UPI00188F1301|nr:LysR family transcriptional regulator [Aliidiomarina indica]
MTYDLNDLFYFAKVVEHRGFAAAGRALNVPKSKLSRRVRKLEDELGMNLLIRSSRAFTITDVGERFYEHCRAMLIEAETAMETAALFQSEPCGTIKLSCPIGLLNFHVGEMLADFMQMYPQVTIHLDATNRRVDVLGEGFDLALRVRPFPLEDSDLVLKVLSSREQCLVAAPRLLAHYGMPNGPREIANLPSLARSNPNESHVWILNKEGHEELRVPFTPRYTTTDMLALKQAALKGVGVVQLPSLMLLDDLERGDLVSLLDGWCPRTEVIHVVFPSRRGMLPSVRALIDFLAARYEDINEI